MKINSEEIFRTNLLDNEFIIDKLLKKNGLKQNQDITTAPNLGRDRTKYRKFKSETTTILASTICEYVDEYGALLKHDVDTCVYNQVKNQSLRSYSDVRIKYFVKSVSAPHTRFNSIIFAHGLKKKTRAVKRLGLTSNYKLDFLKTGEYNSSSIFYIDKEVAIEYLFSRFGKIKRLAVVTNNKPKEKEIIESLEEKIVDYENLSEMEVFGFDDEEKFKKFMKEKDEFFKKNGNGWWLKDIVKFK